MTPPVKMPKVAEIVFKAKLVDELQLKSALREAEKWGGRITRTFNDLKFVPEEKVVEAISKALKLTAINLDALPKDAAACNKLEDTFCEEKGVFPVALQEQGRVLVLAMADPTDFATVEELERRLRVRTKLMVAGEKNIKNAIARHYRGITDERSMNTSGAMAAASGAPMELDGGPMTTGEFMDAKGDIVGKMRHVTNPRGFSPEAVRANESALSGFAAIAGAAEEARSSVADELDHLFGMGPAHPVWSKEDLARLEAARVNQEKGARVFRAVLELCLEKKLFTTADLGRFRS